MYLFFKFGGHRSYKTGDANSYINSYMDILEKSELTVSIRHIARFLKEEEEHRQLQSVSRLT